MESLPNRASDAGPDAVEVIDSWRDLCDLARDDVRSASDYCHDDLDVERNYAIRDLETAIGKLQMAIDLLKQGEI